MRIIRGRLQAAGKEKIFCIGFNKTGTTSVKRAFKSLGYAVGDQRTAELLLDDWAHKKFDRIIRYCRTAQVFQDVPFSLPGTFKVVDEAFPGSRFILTVRDNSEQWYSSITRFHSKLWGDGVRPPSSNELQESTYIYKGHPWDFNQWVFGSPEDDPYNKEVLISCYERHNVAVADYFRERPQDLLVVNVAEDGAYEKFCDFLDVPADQSNFPWANKTAG